MKVYAIVLIVCGCVFAALIILCCLRKGWDRKKKQSRPPTSMRSVAVPSDKRANYVERGGASKSSWNTKDGKMVILAGAGAALDTAVEVDSIVAGGGGDGDGGGSGGCGGCGGCGG